MEVADLIAEIKTRIDKDELQRWTETLRGFRPLKKGEMIAQFSDRLDSLKGLNRFVGQIVNEWGARRSNVVQAIRGIQGEWLGYVNYNDIKDTALRQLIKYTSERGQREETPRIESAPAQKSGRAQLQILSGEIKGRLKQLADCLGLKYAEEYPVAAGRIDVVLLKEEEQARDVPVVGIEIESSSRTRKHIKGDIFNLTVLKPILGIILFVKKGFSSEEKFHDNVKAAKKMLDGYESSNKVVVLSEEEIETAIRHLS
ncbi:MAG: hypothetical protein ACFE7E_08415 [Candidatus Hodarchaeota archaeon]